MCLKLDVRAVANLFLHYYMLIPEHSFHLLPFVDFFKIFFINVLDFIKWIRPACKTISARFERLCATKVAIHSIC